MIAYDYSGVRIFQGHVLDELASMAPESVDCVVTSPPYLYARDYKIPPQTWGGDDGCEHEFGLNAIRRENRIGLGLATSKHTTRGGGHKVGKVGFQNVVSGFCSKCGAWLGSLGQEPTVDLYVEHMVAVFAGVRRVLSERGTCWINLGDVYSNDTKWGGASGAKNYTSGEGGYVGQRGRRESGLGPKQLVGVPWRVALALQADGWTLRAEIIWSKPNCLPESMNDRPTKAHEQIFLFSKQPRYYYNADAIKERASKDTHARYARGRSSSHKYSDGGPGGQTIARSFEHMRAKGVNPKCAEPGEGIRQNSSFSAAVKDTVEWRNKRSVWSIASEPLPDEHYAAYPSELPRTCILAGCPPAGKRCDCDDLILTPTGAGAAEDPSLEVGRAGYSRERRPDEGVRPITRREQRHYAKELRKSPQRRAMEAQAANLHGVAAFGHYLRTDRTGARPIPEDLLKRWLENGWLTVPPPCTCPEEPAGVVLDPFSGSGTTLLVAKELGHAAVGVELSSKYIAIAARRLKQEVLKLA